MTLSHLINKSKPCTTKTATPATTATQKTARKPASVAPVATVAVTSNLPPDNEKRIRAWLARIKEIDPEIINDVLTKCLNDLNARRYFLKRSEEIPEPYPPKE